MCSCFSLASLTLMIFRLVVLWPEFLFISIGKDFTPLVRKYRFANSCFHV
jgi:hypothetical protein